METKLCSKCKLEIDITKFTLLKSGSRVAMCNKCRHAKEYYRMGENPELYERVKKRSRDWARNHRDCQIAKAARGHDRERGMPVDSPDYIDKAWVADAIARGCSYCGESALDKMGVDRVDSSIPHLKSNCVPCCGRCNYMKRDMPIEAWLVIVPGVKAAFEAGLFGAWKGGTHG